VPALRSGETGSTTLDARLTGYREGMTEQPQDEQTHAQPEPEASSDGDGSWTDDPQTQDPHEDRSVEEVVRRTSEG
jgi:hypothetical protein